MRNRCAKCNLITETDADHATAQECIRELNKLLARTRDDLRQASDTLKDAQAEQKAIDQLLAGMDIDTRTVPDVGVYVPTGPDTPSPRLRGVQRALEELGEWRQGTRCSPE